VSPSFVTIYSQASAAEAGQLDQIAGMGYRLVSHSHVKECAKRAAWLGNDETHYTLI
jgi:hypothetical protein